MKRHGNIIEQVVDSVNMNIAFDAVICGKRKTASTRRLKRDNERILKRLANEIQSERYTPTEYREFTVIEGGKERVIQSLPLTDRIALHAIMRPVEQILTPTLIRDTFSSLKGRGIHDGLSRLRLALHDKEATKYCLKLDVRKFYGSVDQDVLISLLARKIKDTKMVRLLTRIIRSYDCGLPIGFHSSQFLGNYYLSGLDQLAKNDLGCKYYYRYCDDVVVLGSSKDELREIFNRIRDYLRDSLKLTIKSNYQIFPVDARGIDFLGYVTTHDKVRLRKRVKKRAVKRLNRLKSRRRRREVEASLWGWAKHADAEKLIIKVFGMKRFNELGISRPNIAGKKRFDGKIMSQSDLVGSTIIVTDYESGVKTQHKDDQYLICATYEGENIKVFTGSPEIKHVLDECREKDFFPFEAVIKRARGNRNIFIFE